MFPDYSQLFSLNVLAQAGQQSSNAQPVTLLPNAQPVTQALPVLPVVPQGPVSLPGHDSTEDTRYA